MRARLDATDWRILKELQADGRLTNVALAQRVGLSPPPCLRRVQALERAGYIRGYHAVIDAPLAGFEVAAFAMVTLRAQGEAELREFENRLLTWPIVREAHMLAGDADYMLKCVAADMSTFQAFILDQLTAHPNVASVKTTVVLREAKREPGAPIEMRR
ncbi:MAG: Lrp/AsnC family transcriptional regulator [Hyphomicrobiaceae bacterium]|nr:Lrp/AsnC family transcriptional regulator [Hyphomicrobiaceae bacterium]